MDDIDRQIAAMVAEGFSERSIAGEVGLSRSAVRKRKAKMAALAEYDEYDDDELTELYDDDELTEVDGLQLLGGGPGPEPEEVVLPLVYVGEEDGSRRYLDSSGRSLSALDFFRLTQWLKHDVGDVDDFTAAHALQADMDRQVAEYEARERVRRADRGKLPKH
jgi:hypothetical protein